MSGLLMLFALPSTFEHCQFFAPSSFWSIASFASSFFLYPLFSCSALSYLTDPPLPIVRFLLFSCKLLNFDDNCFHRVLSLYLLVSVAFSLLISTFPSGLLLPV
jgi:hypothetical protein